MYSSYATKYSAYDIDLNEVINFLQQNPQFLQNEVNPYSVDKLMMLLDNEKLSALEEEFNEHPNGIELPDFVLLMKSTILHPPEDKFRLITGLIKLFQDIDINGDGHMEWSEFTQYIIDAVIGEKDTKFFDARFEKDRELTENEILDKAYSSKTKRYVMSKIVDNTIHLSLIKKINYCGNNDMLAVLEQGAKRIKMYTTQSTLSKEFFEPVFEEKAFVLDCCYSERLNMIGCITTDRRVIVWENTTAKREVVNAKHDVLPTGIWYLENHKVWIVAGADNGLRSYTYGSNERNQTQTEKGPLLSHTKKITEVTEISIPKLVASSSLDGTIKLWDLSDRTLITELKDTSTARGIRGITYSFDYGGNLLSYGFESYINIWCPEVSLTRSYVGKLEGHSHTILCCKFIPGSPNCVSVDEKGNIRLWDIRTLTTIQLISAENSSVVVTELAIIPKHDKFILGGKRMTFYDNSAISKSIKHFNEELYPIAGYYNEYYNTVVVLTKIDLRIYDVLTGKLRKVFTDLTDERFNTSDLSSFTFGGKQRKFYIGDNSGYVRVYNMKNGEIIHKINKINEEQELDKKKDLNKKSLKRRENAEISNIVYLTDEKLLITASWDSTIRIYDESEPDESTLLRIMSGAHRESDINAMAYSSHLNLLASGSGNGIIAIWDLELGKLEQVCLGHTADITALQFLDPFPILVSASSDGSICVWGVRPCAEAYKYKCIIRILNSSWKTEKRADDTEVLTEVRSGITSLVVETENKVFVERQPLTGFPTQHEYRDFVQKSIEKKQETKMAFSHQRNQNKTSNEPEDKEKPHIHMNADEYKALGLEFLDDTLYCPVNKPPDNLEHYETLEDFAKYREAHDAQDPHENEAEQRNKKKRCYVYYGDQKGFMNVIDLAEILKKRDIRPCKSEKRTDSYQLRRKEWIDVSKTVDNMLSNEKLRKTPYSIHSYNTVLVSRWEAHTQAITNINKIDGDQKSLVTCSMDKYVKVWSLGGDLYGGFNLVKLGKKNWGFPFDWTQHKLQEIDDAFSVLNFIEKDEMRRLNDQDKINIKFQYLLNSFGNEKDFVKVIRAFKNNKGIVEKKIETPVKEKDPVKKEFEIPAYLQADIEEKEKERERERMKEKEKTKTKGKGKAPEKAKENLDAKDYGEERKAMATDFKGLAQKVFISIEKFEKEGKKDPKIEKVPSHSNKISNKIRSGDRLKTAGAKIKGFEPLDAMLKTIIGDRKQNEKSGPSSRVGSSLSKRITGLTQNYKSSGVILPAIDGTHEEGITSEDVVYNPRTTTQPGSRATSARPLFSNFSAKTFKKNIDHATKLVKNYAGNPHHPYKNAEPEDIKFRQGEGARTLKMAAKQQIDKFASDSPQIFASEREALASRSEFYRNLRSKNAALQGDGGANSDRDTGREDTYKIIANRLFMEDPEKNKMKVLKSNNRLYVL